MIIRLIVGRGWGQGPTHSQNLHAWFAHVPGLRVFYPAFGVDFEHLFIDSFNHKYPTVFLEDRWVHQSVNESNLEKIREKGTSARVLREGEDATLITFGFNSILGMKVCDFYKEYGLHIEHIDLVSLKPIDFECILRSVNKTRRCVFVDSGFEYASIGSFVANRIYKAAQRELLSPIEVITAGDVPESTSHGSISYIKISARTIALALQSVLGGQSSVNFSKLTPKFHDVPDPSFRGPF